MYLSETQEKELVRLYQDIEKYAIYLKNETYNPYGEVKSFAMRLKQIIDNNENDEKVNSFQEMKDNSFQEKNDYIDYIKNNLKIDWVHNDDKLYLGLILDGEVIDKVRFEEY